MKNPAVTIEELTKERPLILAGPCSAESREQVLETAVQLAGIGIKIFRAGLWKPRTKPGGFEGIGKKGLEWLKEVKERTGMFTATEVANSRHIKEALKGGVDILWIGARTTGNPFAVQEIADSLQGRNIPVLVKNPMITDPDLWIGAIERLQNSGITEVAAIHRGFSTYEKGLLRNQPQWHIPIEVRRRMPSLKIICDPSHIGGNPKLIYPLSQQALDMGFDGLMIESHYKPDKALSDSKQQITPQALKEIINVLVVRDKTDVSGNLEVLRQQMDDLDERLLDIISKRMAISREIGRYKKEKNISVLQPERYDTLISGRVMQAKELKLDEDFIKLIFVALHEESVRQQIDKTS